MSRSRKTTSSPNFPYSNDQIQKAIAPRALPIYTEEELKVREALISEGAQHVMARRKGGQTDRGPAKGAAARQAAIVEIYRDLPLPLRKQPWGNKTLAAVEDGLRCRGHHASVETIRRDLKTLGAQRLKNADSRGYYVWPEPDKQRKLRQPNVKNGQAVGANAATNKLSEKTLQEMEAGRQSLSQIATKNRRKNR
jgi:hypothetical protein